MYMRSDTWSGPNNLAWFDLSNRLTPTLKPHYELDMLTDSEELLARRSVSVPFDIPLPRKLK